MKILKHQNGLVIILAILFSMLFAQIVQGANVYAADKAIPTQTSEKLGATKSAKDSPTGETGKYNIEFAVPGEQSTLPKTVDVVIVMDKSSVADLAGLKTAASNFVDQMLANKDVTFKIGVVWFNYDAHDSLGGLKAVNSSNEAAIKSAIQTYSGSGTNLSSGIKLATDILDGDNAVPDTQKYMIVCSDFGTYIQDDGTGSGRGLIRFAKTGADSAIYVGPNDYGQKYGFTGNETGLPFQRTAASFSVNDISNLINNKILLSGTAAKANTLDTLGSITNDYYGSSTDFTNPVNAKADIANLDTLADMMAADYPTSREKSVYQSGKYMLDAKSKGYNLIGITTDYKKDSLPALHAWADVFQEWFEQNIGTRYDIPSGNSIDKVFEDITNDIFYLINSGKIVDVVADEFTVGDIKDFKVKVGSAELKATLLSNTEVAFGNPDSNGVYPYVAKYDAGATAGETVSLTINVTVSKYDLLKFDFPIELKNDYKSDGVKYLETNKSAEIQYTDSAGNDHVDTVKSPIVKVGEDDAVKGDTETPSTSSIETDPQVKGQEAKTADSFDMTLLIVLSAVALTAVITLIARKRHQQ